MAAYVRVCMHMRIYMLWGCMTGDGVGPLHKIERSMNQYMYKGILKEHLPKCMQDMPFAVEEIIFQRDPDPKHTAKSVTN